MNAGVYPTAPEDYIGQFDNGLYKNVIKVGQGNYKLFGRIDLQVDLTQDISQSERLYQQSKRIMGITDSYQGQADSTAQSGKAKQIQVNQSAGRLDSKRKMKNAAYAEIDEVISYTILLTPTSRAQCLTSIVWAGCKMLNSTDTILSNATKTANITTTHNICSEQI